MANAHDQDSCREDLAWVESTLVSFAALNTTLVPAGFDRYVRIAHSPRDESAPLDGQLTRAEATALSEVFSRACPRQQWHFAIWDGYSQAPPPWPYCPSDLKIPKRRFLVSVGELEDLMLWYDRPFKFLREPVPSMWWPLDRSVFVHSEIDLYSTYVGCSAEVADQIVGSPSLEAMSVAADFPIAGT